MATGSAEFAHHASKVVRVLNWGPPVAGIKTPGRPDLVVMEIAPGSSVAGLFTQNALLCRSGSQLPEQHLALLPAPAYMLTNTGNANAGTGEPGIA